MNSDQAIQRTEDTAEGRAVPHSIEAEQAVIGGLLLVPERFDLIEGRLTEEDFFSPAYGAVFGAICDLSRRGQPIDILVLRDELEKRKKLERVGGQAGLIALVDSVPTGAHVEFYAQIVRDKSMLRRLISAASEIVEAATNTAETATSIMDQAEHLIFEVATRGSTGDAKNIGQVLKNTWEKIEADEGGHGVTGISTGYYELDEKTAGLHSDELIIIAGRPAMGKSTFALNLLRHMSVKEKSPCVLYSLEMSDENLVRNMMCAEAKINAENLRKMRLTGEDRSKLLMASDRLLSAPIWVDDTPSISLAELRGKTRRLKSRHDIQAVFIDYLQLMMASSTARNRSREQEVSEISRGLKALAKELSIPVIALAQLSRRPEGRQDNRPILSDLRESGAIEQDADVVLLLHRPDYYDSEETPGQTEVIVAKQRNGPTGTVNLMFINNQLRFENLSVRPDEGSYAGEEEF